MIPIKRHPSVGSIILTGIWQRGCYVVDLIQPLLLRHFNPITSIRETCFSLYTTGNPNSREAARLKITQQRLGRG